MGRGSLVLFQRIRILYLVVKCFTVHVLYSKFRNGTQSFIQEHKLPEIAVRILILPKATILIDRLPERSCSYTHSFKRYYWFSRMSVHIRCGLISDLLDLRSWRTYLVQFTAGIAYPLSRACSKSLTRLSPVTTPGGTISVMEDILSNLIMFGDYGIRVTVS